MKSLDHYCIGGDGVSPPLLFSERPRVFAAFVKERGDEGDDDLASFDDNDNNANHAAR